MVQIDRVQYVKDLEIGDLNESFPVSRDLGGYDMSTADGVEQSYLNAKSIVSFVSDISGQQRDDVLNSVLVAQLAANKKFPGNDQSLDWYTEFIKVLNNLGWVIQGAEFSHFESKEAVFEVEGVIIDILTAAFGGTFITVVTKALDAIKSLSDSNGKITAFENNTHSISHGAFQIGLASEQNGAVALQIGTFLITSSQEIKRILFFRSSKDKTSLDYCSRTGTLDSTIYEKVRAEVLSKLGDKATSFIAQLDI